MALCLSGLHTAKCREKNDESFTNANLWPACWGTRCFSGIEIAGPFAGQMFAEWGAEVIWIENVAWADTIRVQPNYPQLSRRNLHALSLNIFKDEGREAFLKLMETTDIFIEASKGPAFARRGITDEVLWEHNPKLVIAHLSGFGQYGTEEYTNLPAYNTIAQAFSGYLIQNGDVDQPMPAFPYTADYFSGMTATTAALAALHKVRETGKGESIDIAMYEVMLRMGQYFMMDYFNGGEICPRMTKGKDPYYAGCGLYKCADGYIVMELVGITQINECFKDIGPPTFSVRRKFRKAHNSSIAWNALTARSSKRNWTPGWQHTPSPTFRRVLLN